MKLEALEHFSLYIPCIKPSVRSHLVGAWLISHWSIHTIAQPTEQVEAKGKKNILYIRSNKIQYKFINRGM